MDDFVKNFKQRSRHHSKLINFIYPELIKLNGTNILEFGVSEQAMSSELFLNFSDSEEFNVYSIDNVNYQNKFKNKNWNFIHSRDDDFEFVKKNLPEQFSLILLDTIHEASHVKKIIYNYYDFLNVNSCFFIDDISWLPYARNGDKNRFYGEINNQETFELLLEIFFNNSANIDIEFNFQGTGMCKIRKLRNNKLNQPKKILSRKNSFKNLIRKTIK